MRKVIFVILSAITIALYQNCGARHDTNSTADNNSSNGQVAVSNLASIAAYEKTLFPLVTGSTNGCASCHGVSQQPLHSLPDAAQAHDVTLSFGLIDFTDPSQSRLVDKVRRGHQGIAESSADDLEAAIVAWIAEVEASGGTITDDPTELQATFSSIKLNILDPKCLSCHSPAGSRPSEDYTSYTSTINTGGVEAGDALGSEMFQECSSGSMPKNGTALTFQELSVIQDWINQGAPNN